MESVYDYDAIDCLLYLSRKAGFQCSMSFMGLTLSSGNLLSVTNIYSILVINQFNSERYILIQNKINEGADHN